MDKRKLRLVLLGAVGILLVVLGTGALKVYSSQPSLNEMKYHIIADTFGQEYETLSETTKARLAEEREEESFTDMARREIVKKANREFAQWSIKWVVKPFGLFLILTAALVVSRVISNKIRPPSGPS